MWGAVLGGDAAGSVSYEPLSGSLMVAGVLGPLSEFGDLFSQQPKLHSLGGNDAWLTKVWDCAPEKQPNATGCG